MEGVGFFLLESLAVAALVVFWYMMWLYLMALGRRDNSIADIAWGPGFILAALAVLWWHAPAPVRPVVATVLVSVWGLRLAVHLLLRNWGRGEDWRYAQWRVKWGAWWPLRSFLQVFMLQGGLLLVISLPVLWINTYGGAPLGWLDALGALVWLAGFLMETVADHQLVRFQKDPANYGRILMGGLWRYSRHPNYFGEILMWWGLWLIALSVPGGWMSVVGPLTVTILILKVSGVPLTESRQLSNPEFRDYAARTSPMVPWFPKK